MTKMTYALTFGFCYLFALLPLRMLYALADAVYYPLYYLIRYRRAIVRRNLEHSFPEKSHAEIVATEKRFYHFFCDYLVETLKMLRMSRAQMTKRLTFEGVDDIIAEMNETDNPLCFVYLGHYGNWEWIASLPYWVPDEVLCAQIYHPLRNKAVDKLFLRLRNQFGGESIPMKVTLRRILQLKREQQRCIVGFISDQLPKWSLIHHFTPFLHRETAVFTGTEQMGKKLGAMVYYAEVTRPCRGYYHCHFKKLVDNPTALPDFQLTDLFAQQLEEMITHTPHLWLWTHNRWKRTKEEYEERMKNATKVNE